MRILGIEFDSRAKLCRGLLFCSPRQMRRGSTGYDTWPFLDVFSGPDEQPLGELEVVLLGGEDFGEILGADGLGLRRGGGGEG